MPLSVVRSACRGGGVLLPIPTNGTGFTDFARQLLS